MNLDEILAMSAGLMSIGIYSINVNFPKMRGIQYVLLAASNRKPSTPKERRSFAYSASRWRTGSVSVARLPHNNRQHIRIDLEIDAYSARPSSWQVHTSTSLYQLAMLLSGSRPQ